MGQVERMIWWKGTDTMALLPRISPVIGYVGKGTDSDTLDIAMLTVKRNEKLIKTIFSRVVSFDILKCPRNKSM